MCWRMAGESCWMRWLLGWEVGMVTDSNLIVCGEFWCLNKIDRIRIMAQQFHSSQSNHFLASIRALSRRRVFPTSKSRKIIPLTSCDWWLNTCDKQFHQEEEWCLPRCSEDTTRDRARCWSATASWWCSLMTLIRPMLCPRSIHQENR